MYPSLFDNLKSSGGTLEVTEYDYNLQGRMSEVRIDLDADGKRAAVVETDASDEQIRVEWLYDNLGRLTDEDFDFNYNGTFAPDRSTDYTLDLIGNRLKKEVDATVDETITYTYDDNDRLLRETKTVANTTTFYQYGGSTNPHTVQTAKTTYSGILTVPSGSKLSETTYDYNLQGRMSESSVDADGDGAGAAVVTTYTYDDTGTRVSQTEDGTKTVYLNDKQNPTGYSQVLEEKDASDNVVKTYTLGHDVIAQQAPSVESGDTLYLSKDGHGSTRLLLNPSGNIVTDQVFAYDAFGERLDSASPLTSHLYCGEICDNTGLIYLRQRYYRPGSGAFTTLDPFAGDTQDPQSLLKYLYCHANPIMGIDPRGLFTQAFGYLVEAAIEKDHMITFPFVNTGRKVQRLPVEKCSTRGLGVFSITWGKTFGKRILPPHGEGRL